MDPNETLRQIRERATAIQSEGDWPATELANDILALDEWLKTGGFLPDDWSPWPANRYKDYDDHVVICRDCSTRSYVATIPIDQTAAHDKWHDTERIATGGRPQ